MANKFKAVIESTAGEKKTHSSFPQRLLKEDPEKELEKTKVRLKYDNAHQLKIGYFLLRAYGLEPLTVHKTRNGRRKEVRTLYAYVEPPLVKRIKMEFQKQLIKAWDIQIKAALTVFLASNIHVPEEN